jgi:hypothetical protein
VATISSVMLCYYAPHFINRAIRLNEFGGQHVPQAHAIVPVFARLVEYPPHCFSVGFIACAPGTSGHSANPESILGKQNCSEGW